MSETQLRAWETQVLGPEHAADHAALRRDARVDKNVPTGPVGGFRLYEHSAAIAPSVGGQWNGRFDIPVIGINAAMLPTGKVLWYAYPNEPDSAPRHNEAWAAVWDPSLGTGPNAFTRVDPPIDPATGLSVNIWCSGTSFLADGRVLVTGGNLSYINTPGATYSGLKHVYTFNPFNQTWTQQPDMAHGRWYPGQLLLPDGRTVIINGFDEQGIGARNVDVELFTPSPDLNGIGKITKIGTLTGDYVGDYYPHMFWMPSGRALIAGPYTNDSWYLNNPGPSNAFSITDVSNLNRTRIWGDAVIVPSAKAGSTKVLEIGGANTTLDYDNAFASNTTEQFDEANPGAGWIPESSQNIARAHANTVLLPDGSMVTVGGGVGNDSTRNKLWTANPDQMQVELWDPTTKQWTIGPAQLENRAYHSTAILLPDGRVLSAGDDRNGGFDRDTAELYEPAYLFKGPRPTITTAPTKLQYNASFTITTPNTNITKAVLIAPSAATHAINTNQRYVPLTLTQHAGGITATAPLNANIALPGYYMLFILTDKGVPSIAKWVRIMPGKATGSGHAGPPKLSQVPAKPLRALAANGNLRLTTGIQVDQPATVTVAVQSVQTGATVSSLKGSSLGPSTLKTGAPKLTATTAGAATLKLNLLLPSAKLLRGKRYTVLVTASAPQGARSVLRLGFTR